MRHLRAVGICRQFLHAFRHSAVIVLKSADLEEQLGKIEGFYIDPVLLHRDLIKTHCLECSRPGAQAADIEPSHAVHDTADRGKITEILLKFCRKRVNHMRLQDREGKPVLCKDIRHRKFPAERVPSVCKIHLADLIRVGLKQNRNPGVLQRGYSAILIRKNRHRENDAIVFPSVLLQPFMI